MKSEVDGVVLPRILQVGEYAPVTPRTILIQLVGPFSSCWRIALIKGFIARATSNWSHSLQGRVLKDILFVVPVSFKKEDELVSLCVQGVACDHEVDTAEALDMFEMYHYGQVLDRSAFGAVFFYLPCPRSYSSEETSFLSRFHSDVARVALQAHLKGCLGRVLVVYDEHEPTSSNLFRGLPEQLIRRKDFGSPETSGSNLADYIEKFLARS